MLYLLFFFVSTQACALILFYLLFICYCYKIFVDFCMYNKNHWIEYKWGMEPFTIQACKQHLYFFLIIFVMYPFSVILFFFFFLKIRITLIFGSFFVCIIWLFAILAHWEHLILEPFMRMKINTMRSEHIYLFWMCLNWDFIVDCSLCKLTSLCALLSCLFIKICIFCSLFVIRFTFFVIILFLFYLYSKSHKSMLIQKVHKTLKINVIQHYLSNLSSKFIWKRVHVHILHSFVLILSRVISIRDLNA